jgi:hypothetical protein
MEKSREKIKLSAARGVDFCECIDEHVLEAVAHS